MKFLNRVLFVGMLLSSVSCGINRNKQANQNSINMARSLKTSPTFKSRAAATKFEQNLPADFPLPEVEDAVASRILKDYGAVFVARDTVVTPPKIIFKSEEDCADWQANVPKRQENFGGINSAELILNCKRQRCANCSPRVRKQTLGILILQLAELWRRGAIMTIR